MTEGAAKGEPALSKTATGLLRYPRRSSCPPKIRREDVTHGVTIPSGEMTFGVNRLGETVMRRCSGIHQLDSSASRIASVRAGNTLPGRHLANGKRKLASTRCCAGCRLVKVSPDHVLAPSMVLRGSRCARLRF